MRILVGLIEHIGDIVACEPVSRYLRFKYPTAHVQWAVAERFRELIDVNPQVDETITLDCLTDWMKLSAHAGHDLIVDLHVNYRICQHCRIPLVKKNGNPFVNAFEWLKFGSLLEAFSLGAGLPRLSAAPLVYIQPEHEVAVDALGLPQRFCVIHRDSNDKEKDWTPQKWVELAAIIRDELGLPIVEIGAGRRAATPSLGDGVIDLFNRLPLLQTADVVRRAAMFIGVDSGPAHFANAARTPGVVLLGKYAYMRQYNPFTGFYASDAPDVQIVRNLNGPVRQLSVGDVAEAVRYVAHVTPTRDAASAKPPAEASPSQDSDAAARTDAVTDQRSASGDVEESGFFDAAWYCTHYPDVATSGLDPLSHYLTFGTREGREPGPDFSAEFYRKLYPDVIAADIDPLAHYAQQGVEEGRMREVQAVSPKLAEALPVDMTAGPLLDRLSPATMANPPVPAAKLAGMPRTFAFYLPQFHPIAENDWAHAPGFTEWNNVVAAKPLFRGHYQPRKPGALGFYDLRSREVLDQQISLALENGIDGFCFYYYYFKGKKLLYKPLENYIQSDAKAPFLLLWANENWSKRWDGGDRELIIAQHHSKEDDLAFIREIATLFRDDRYVKVNGKPVLMVYKTQLFPDIVATVETWRQEIERLGFPGIYLVMVDDWTQDLDQPRNFGFDATYEIPSNLVPADVLVSDTAALDLAEDFNGRIVDYRKFAAYHAGRPFPQYKRFRTVMLPWDNTARYASRAMVHVHGTGDSYKRWLLQALLDTYQRYEREERFVFIHSWNEWCEGTYLEPDGRSGTLFLDQTRDAIAIARQSIALMGGDHAPLLAELFRTQQLKDEGVFRVLNAARVQTAHLWQQAEFQRQHILTLEAALARFRRLGGDAASG